MESAITILLFTLLVESTPFAAASCGTPKIQPSQSRIVGGHEARRGSLPWMAMLAELNYPKCGGAIINEYTILTASHCFETRASRDPRRWTVMLGKHHTNRYDVTQRIYHVRQIIRHEYYNDRTIENDVALVVLWDKIRYTDYISPICLPKPNSTLMVGETCLISGWGDTLGTSTSTVLNQVNVPIIGDDVCSLPNWYGSEFIPLTTFCAGYSTGGKDACSGDSGGPLVCSNGGTWYVHGVASWGYGCAEARWPGVYTDVSAYLPWILHTIASLKHPYCLGFCNK